MRSHLQAMLRPAGERRGATLAVGKRRMNQQALSSLIWSVADLLRGDFKQSEYGRVILPFTVLRRLDCVLARPPRPPVLAEHAPSGRPASTPSPSCCARPG
jgi:type I restriction enzyme M protein